MSQRVLGLRSILDNIIVYNIINHFFKHINLVCSDITLKNIC